MPRQHRENRFLERRGREDYRDHRRDYNDTIEYRRDYGDYGDSRRFMSGRNRINRAGSSTMPPGEYGGNNMPPSDYGRGLNDFRDYRDYRDYAEDMEDEWEEDLKKWCKKLKRQDKFNLPKEEILTQAKQMGVRFDNYTEDEFVCTVEMLISDFPTVSNQSQTYLAMAKDWLEDDDVEMQGSEKLAAYYYTIVKGE